MTLSHELSCSRNGNHIIPYTGIVKYKCEATWDLTGDILKEYVDYLASQKLVEPTAAMDRETLFSGMKDFT